MSTDDKLNILLVDDQPGKLLSYETILVGMDENILKASSGREALEHLLKNDIAVMLIDVCMPDLDGFQLAAMIREHPRFRQTAIIFISAIFLSDLDSLRGYEMGAVDYVPVPIVPEVLRAKVKVFTELYRKTRQLEQLNHELEARVAARTLELEESNRRLRESEERRSHALSAGQMGAWEWDCDTGNYTWDDGQHRIFGASDAFIASSENVCALIHPDDREIYLKMLDEIVDGGVSRQFEFRIGRPGGRVKWCLVSAAATARQNDKVHRISGVTFDITGRKEAEEQQNLLAREVDHRAKNTLAVVQSILRLSRAENVDDYISSVEGRVHALSRAHNLLSQARWLGVSLNGLFEEELEPYRAAEKIALKGPDVALRSAAAQSLALAIHELSTNAAKYGALSSLEGRLVVEWTLADGQLIIDWHELDGPPVVTPKKRGFGTNILLGSVEKQLSGVVKMDWIPTGLSCRISIPAAASIERADLAQTRSNGSNGGATFQQATPIVTGGTDSNKLIGNGADDERLVGSSSSGRQNRVEGARR
ncbi:MAG TPA: HWE histidine kinase domain-containing protein [Pseudolabrys sp.]|jgi:PAS domain S-box-containing protein|nr:HWE histidine kinase domain-containing protein [Pseudolabrys sp.]